MLEPIPSPRRWSPRSWLTFSLRTMFVVVTVMAIFIAYHVNWIRQRHRLIVEEDLKRDGHVSWSGVPGVRAPGVLWLFGENGVNTTFVMVEGEDIDHLTTSDMGRVKKARQLFPEAIIGAIYIRIREDGSMYYWKAVIPPDRE